MHASLPRGALLDRQPIESFIIPLIPAFVIGQERSVAILKWLVHVLVNGEIKRRLELKCG